MTRPELKNYQTKAFHHFDMDKYAKDLNEYIDYLEQKINGSPAPKTDWDAIAKESAKAMEDKMKK